MSVAVRILLRVFAAPASLCLCVAGAAPAAEIGKLWYDLKERKPYTSEHAVQQVIRQRAESSAQTWEVARQRVDDERTTYSYFPVPVEPVMSEWEYGNGMKTEAALVAWLKARRASAPGCQEPDVEYTWPEVPEEPHDANQSTWATVISYKGLKCATAYKSVDRISRTRTRTCPKWMLYDNGINACAMSRNYAGRSDFQYYSEPLAGGCEVGNPCNPATGDKHQVEQDIVLPWIQWQRHYHSASSTLQAGLGAGWTHEHHVRLSVITSSPHAFIDGNGAQRRIVSRKGRYVLADDLNTVVERVGTFEYRLLGDNETLQFNEQGRLTLRERSDGTSLRYQYNARSQLVAITDGSGRALQFHYGTGSQDHLISHISSAGEVLVLYQYAQDRLVSAAYADGSARVYHYEDSRFPDHLTGITAEDGQRFAWYAYDEKGRATCSQHSPGCDTATVGVDGVRLQYLADGSSQVTDANGGVQHFVWSGGGNRGPRRLAATTDARGTRTQTREPGVAGRLLESVDRSGVRTTYAYSEDASVQRTTVTEAAGRPENRAQTITRDIASNQVLTVAEPGRRFTFAYNPRRQLTREAVEDLASGQVRASTFTYCEAEGPGCGHIGQLQQVDGPRTDVADLTQLRYYEQDDSGCATSGGTCNFRKADLRSVTDPVGTTRTVLAYDPHGRVLSETDGNGVRSDYQYHQRGWLQQHTVRGQTPAQDRTTRYAWTAGGQLQQLTDADGATLTWLYDSAQRLTDITDGAGNSLHFQLDAAGNRVGEHRVDAGGQLSQTLQRSFDTLGRLIALRNAAGAATGYGYDLQDNLRSIRDALSRTRVLEHDARGRVRTSTEDVDGIAARTGFAHGSDDLLQQVQDPKQLLTRYTRDGLGNTLELRSPDTGTATYVHDAAGNTVQRTDARGITTQHRYDALNRLLASTGPDPALEVRYRYDTAMERCPAEQRHAQGRLSEVTHAHGRTVYCHDRFGQLRSKLQHSDGVTLRVGYDYTAAGRLHRITLPDGTRIDYARDGQGHVSAMTLQPEGQPPQTLLSEVGHAPFGPILGWTYGNGRRLQRPLDLDHRPRAVQDDRPGGLTLAFEYDAAGQLTVLREGAAGSVLARYAYDGLGRLRQVQTANGQPQQLYQWDATGNRLSAATQQGTQAYHYETASHRLLSSGETLRSYDANGNTVRLGQRRYRYNAANRMDAAYEGDTLLERYAYNHLGERIRREPADGAAVYTLYDEAGHWLGDYSTDGSALQQAVWLEDYPVALLSPPQRGIPALAYIQPDHLGTPRVLIDSQRDVALWTWPLEKDAFGTHAPDQNADGDGVVMDFKLRFPGQQYTAATGLYYNYQRDLDADTGRYVQSDPIGLLGGISTYGYVGGRPLGLVDPLGLEAVGSFNNGGHRNSWEDGINVRTPDYVKAQGSLFTFSLSVIVSRSGAVFAGGGVERPYSAPANLNLKVSDFFSLGFSVSAGWANTATCNVMDLDMIDEAISGHSLSGAFGYRGLGGGVGTLGKFGTATEVGFGIGTSVTFGEYHLPLETRFKGWK